MKECEMYDCSNPCEGNTSYCASHNRQVRKEQLEVLKKAEKRRALLSKPKTIYKKPNKVGTKNTWACSDGTRLNQYEIDTKLTEAYRIKYTKGNSCTCEGCGRWADSSAHIIAKSRCKQIGKTELTWDENNFFPACFECNSAIENPKGTEWKNLKNIDKCIAFIYDHDKELYFKFEAQGWQSKKAEGQII
jgi:hypothetical protein